MSTKSKSSKIEDAPGAKTVRRRVQYVPKGEKLTKQSFAAECDMRNIMARFVKTGELPSYREAFYGEEPGGDFTDAQFAVARLKSDFENLPEEEKQKHGDYLGLANYLEQEIEKEYAGESAFDPENNPDPSSPADTERSDGGEAPSDEGASQSS